MEYIIVIGVLIISAFLYFKLAKKFNIVDNPNFRSSHTKPTISGGGVLFFLAVLCFFITSGFQYPYFLIGLTIIAVLGFLDDIFTLSVKIRLFFQFLVVVLLFMQLQLFAAPFYLVFLLIIAAIGFINSYNFMDGINGITGLYSLSVLLGFYYLNYVTQLIELNLIVYLMLSVVVFGYFNFRKNAIMFAGNIGSMSLAFVVLFLTLTFVIQLKAPVVLLFLVVYGIDSGLTVLYRIYLKENIIKPHRYHIYERLVDVKKWSHLKVSVVYVILQLLINTIVLGSYKLPIFKQLIVMMLVVATLMVLYVIVFKIINRAALKVN